MKEEMSSKDTENGNKSPKPVNPFLSEDVFGRPKSTVEKKESKTQSEMRCKKFLEKYSTNDLDDGIKRRIERFAKKGDKSPNVILEKLFGLTCPPTMTVEWTNVADKVICYLVKHGHIQIVGKYVNS